MECVAFGPQDSYVVVPTSEDFVSFGHGELSLSWLQDESSIAHAAYSGDDGYFVRYEDGRSEWRLHPKLGKLIKREGVEWIKFGSDDSYIFKSDEGQLHWYNLPDELDRRLKSSRPSDELVSVGLGSNRSYVAIFPTDFIWHGCVPDTLVQILQTGKIPGKKKATVETLDAVWLSAYDKRFYLEYNGGAAYWSGLNSYFDTMMTCDAMLNPLEISYTQDSISASFADGRSIYDAAKSLNNQTMRITDFPMINVFEHAGRYFSKNNRRLWAFRNSGVRFAPVRIIAKPSDLDNFTQRKEIYIRYK